MNNETHNDNMDFDTRLTAFALGEMDDRDAEAFAREIDGDHDAATLIESIRDAGATITAALAAEPALELTPLQRARIEQGAVSADTTDHRTFRFSGYRIAALAAAACLAIAAVTAVIVQRSRVESQYAIGTADEMPGVAEVQTPDALEQKIMAATPMSRSAKESTSVANAVSADASMPAAAPRLRRQVDLDPNVWPSLSRSVAVRPAGEATAGGPGRSVAAEGAITAGRPARISTPRRAGTPTQAGAAGGNRAEVEGLYELGVPPAAAGARIARQTFGVDEIDFRVEDNLGREDYAVIADNPFFNPFDEPRSTFSIDVDTACFSNVRRYVTGGRMPPPDAVRIEELINYFDYDYAQPEGPHPFSVQVETGPAPWNAEHRLVRIGLQGRTVDVDERPATNLVFLVDVSGSMSPPNKLGLVKKSLRMLVDRLTADDRIAIVTYAGSAGVALPSTYCFDRDTIIAAIDGLRTGGGTNGGAGIELAYAAATDHFIEGGVNRVILCTDGDFNVGVSNLGGLKRMAEQKRETGVFLSVMGFGTGNLQDAKMEAISNAGNGNYGYIDNEDEARKVFVEDMAGTLVTIAKDVKIQVEFNPQHVGAYRLIGYENRMLETQDFRDDKKDAGEIGAGHSMTALYEIVPPGAALAAAGKDDELKYQEAGADRDLVDSDELLTVKLRYKQPDGDTSTELEVPVVDEGHGLSASSADFRFAAALAAYGMILRDSPHKGDASYAMVLDLAATGLDDDADPREDARRRAFADMVEMTRAIASQPVGGESLRRVPAIEQKIPEPLTEPQVQAMTRAERIRMMGTIAEARTYARSTGDAELEARLNRDWDTLKNSMGK